VTRSDAEWNSGYTTGLTVACEIALFVAGAWMAIRLRESVADLRLELRQLERRFGEPEVPAEEPPVPVRKVQEAKS
jgi:hypothetical protein